MNPKFKKDKPPRQNKRERKERETREERLTCASCSNPMDVEFFRMGEGFYANTRAQFKCRKCGQIMTRVEKWFKKEDFKYDKFTKERILG